MNAITIEEDLLWAYNLNINVKVHSCGDDHLDEKWMKRRFSPWIQYTSITYHSMPHSIPLIIISSEKHFQNSVFWKTINQTHNKSKKNLQKMASQHIWIVIDYIPLFFSQLQDRNKSIV